MKKTKLFGIELCRGLAAYAVILVHSGDETWGLPVDPSATAFRMLFYFAVPFFLAAAFYFMTAKPELTYSAKFWQSRVERLIIPYAIWSTIFFVARLVVFTLTNRPNRLQQFLQDPLAIVFLGGASYHLYFLPLLLAGTALVLLIPILHQLKVGRYTLVFASIVSLLLYHLLQSSGNAFQLGSYIAFQNWLADRQLVPEQVPMLRLALVELAWMVRCLPYFIIALTLHQILQSPQFSRPVLATAGCGIAFAISNSLGRIFLPEALQELLLAYTLLFFGFALSTYLSEGKLTCLAASLGTCSFGIYLIHPSIMNLIKPSVSKLFSPAMVSISITFTLLLSISCFLVSWLTVICLNKNKLIARYLFGV